MLLHERANASVTLHTGVPFSAEMLHCSPFWVLGMQPMLFMLVVNTFCVFGESCQGSLTGHVGLAALPGGTERLIWGSVQRDGSARMSGGVISTLQLAASVVWDAHCMARPFARLGVCTPQTWYTVKPEVCWTLGMF